MKKPPLSVVFSVFLVIVVVALAHGDLRRGSGSGSASSQLVVPNQISITFVAPPDEAILYPGADCIIRWVHQFSSQPIPATCQIYCVFPSTSNVISKYAISNWISATQDHFDWTVGRQADGTSMPNGSYQIAMKRIPPPLEVPTDVGSSGPPNEFHVIGPFITINPLKLNLDRFNKLLIRKIPDCPMCYGLPLDQLRLEVLFPFKLELFRGQRRLGELGKFVPGRLLTGTAKLVLEKADLLLIQQGEAGFELRAIIEDNKLLRTKALALVLQK